ncbi:MAG TPA: ATP-binding protein, partial [Chloroflexota bacterium]|nr:ATP-binding protein [Chloroflexota bacterium]
MFAMTYGVNQLSQAERKEAAIAAENARLYQEVLLRNRELATINALTQSASQDTDPDRLFESGLEMILSSIPSAGGQAFSYTRRDDEIELLFMRQPCLGGEHAEEAVREAARAARSRTAVIGPATTLGDDPAVRVSVPVLVQGGTAGVVQAYMPISADEQEPAQSLTLACQELGSLVERALLRAAAQRNLVLEEKSRIAHELHDTVLQLLFSSNLSVEWCLHHSASDNLMTKKLCDIRRLTAQASNELRSAIFTLSSRIAEIGLLPALEQLTTSFAEQYELPVSFSAIGQPPAGLSMLAQNALHRVVRESLMNVYKHARASHATVRIVFEHDSITAVVQDDGVGLPAHVMERSMDDAAHFGLRAVARQVEAVQGHLEIMRGDEGGTIVRAIVPAKPEPGGIAFDRIAAH